MEYNKLISVTGMTGLFEMVSSKTDGAIVKSLEDGTTKFVSSRVHNFSHLESIEVYTTSDNINLIEVFKAMQTNTAAKPDGKDVVALKKYFETIYPTIDFERVYNSDLKKMVKWLAILEKNDVAITLPEAATDSETDEEAKEVKVTKEATKPKATTPKAAAIKKAPAQKINMPRKMA